MQDHNNVETDGTVNHSVAAAVPHKNNPMPGYDQPYVTSRTATYQVLDDAMHLLRREAGRYRKARSCGPRRTF